MNIDSKSIKMDGKSIKFGSRLKQRAQEREVRKAAEECRPLPKLEVVMLLPKPDPKNLENGWSDGREVQRLLEEKLHKKACKDAKNASKRAKKAEGFAKKVRSRRPVVLGCLHFVDVTRI